MSIIENVIIRLGVRYHNDDKFDDKVAYKDRTPQDILELEIPLSGGTARYTIDLPPGMKKFIEFAVELSKKR